MAGDQLNASTATRYVELGGSRFRYWTKAGTEKSGAPTTVFLHGYSFSIDDWLRIGTLDAVSKLGGPVCAIDLPVGRKTRSTKVVYDRLEAYMPLLEDLFGKLEGGSRPASSGIIPVGASLGGSFALEYALAHPDQVKGLVLVGPALKSLDLEEGRLEISFDPRELSAFKAPTLLVWGENDSFQSARAVGEKLHREMPNSQLVMLRGAGHAAYLDRPQEFNEVLGRFIRERHQGSAQA